MAMPDPRLAALTDALIPGAAEANAAAKWTERARCIGHLIEAATLQAVPA